MRGVERYIRQQMEAVHTPQPTSSGATSIVETNPMEELATAKELHDQGILTDEEFAEQKRRILEAGPSYGNKTPLPTEPTAQEDRR